MGNSERLNIHIIVHIISIRGGTLWLDNDSNLSDIYNFLGTNVQLNDLSKFIINIIFLGFSRYKNYLYDILLFVFYAPINFLYVIIIM